MKPLQMLPLSGLGKNPAPGTCRAGQGTAGWFPVQVVKSGRELGDFLLWHMTVCKHVTEKSQEERRNLAKGLGVARNGGKGGARSLAEIKAGGIAPLSAWLGQRGFLRLSWEAREGARCGEAPVSLLAAHNPGHLLPLVIPGKADTPEHLSAMASGNDGDPPRAHGRRGSNGRRLSQEPNSGKNLAVIFRGGSIFNPFFNFYFSPAAFL